MNEADAGDRFGGKIPTSTCLGELIFNSACPHIYYAAATGAGINHLVGRQIKRAIFWFE